MQGANPCRLAITTKGMSMQLVSEQLSGVSKSITIIPRTATVYESTDVYNSTPLNYYRQFYPLMSDYGACLDRDTSWMVYYA